MSLKVLTDQISKMSNTEFNLVTNRAASAIHLSLSCYARKGIILMPSNICLSPIMAAKIANYDIEFIGTDHFQMDLSEALMKIKTNKNVNAILLPELYGYPIKNLTNFWNAIREREILVIEDLAQTLGKSRLSDFIGKPTVVTIYSFGPTKIIDSIRCGVVSTRDGSFFQELASHEIQLGVNSFEIFQEASLQYNNLYGNLLNQSETERNWPAFYTSASQLSPTLFTPRYPLSDFSANFAFDEARITQIRNSRHARFVDFFSNYQEVMVPSELEIKHPVWRTTIRIAHERREQIVEELRSYYLPVSTWYKAMHRMFQGQVENHTQSLVEAVRFENEVINLFLDLPNFDDYFERVKRVIMKRLD
jgi:dTDP-4-amino-4,6-dideoxygalactose transaminase